MFGGIALLLLVAAGLVAAGVVIAAVVSAVRKRPDEAAVEDLDALGRSLLRKVRDERDELAKVADTMGGPLALDALGEAETLYQQSVRAAEKRVELRALARAKSKADYELRGLEARLNTAREAEKPHLIDAINSKRNESQQYAKAEDAIASIESRMQAAAAAISEVRAQLAVRQGSVDQARYESDELGGLVTRLRTMSQSYEEAEQYLNQQ